MSIIYHIENNQHKHYIGKLEDSTHDYPNFLVYHWNNIYQIKKYGAAFEHEGARYVSENGMNKDNYIYRTHSIPVSDALGIVKTQLIAAASKITNSQDANKYATGGIDTFEKHWNFDDKSMCEVLLICLAYKSHKNMLNYQIDHMGYLNNNQREAQSFLIGHIVSDDINKKLEAQLRDIPMFSVLRSISLENFNKLEVELQDQILKIFKKDWHISKEGNKSKVINGVDFPKFIKKFTNNLLEETDKIFEKEFPKYMNQFTEGSEIRIALEKIYNNALNKDKKTRLQALLTNYNKQSDKIKQLTIDYLKEGKIKNFNGEEKIFCDIYNEFYRISNLYTNFLNGYANTVSERNAVKKVFLDQFISYIQKQIFEQNYINNYSSETLKIYQEQLDKQEEPFHFTSRYYRKYLNPDLQQKDMVGPFGSGMHYLMQKLDTLTLSAPESLPFVFVQKNGRYIYDEQVSYGMNEAYPEALVVSHRKLFYRLPKITTNKKNMQGY